MLSIVDDSTGEFLSYAEEFELLHDGYHASFNLIVRTYPDGTQQFRYLSSLVDSGGIRKEITHANKSSADSDIALRVSCCRSKTAIFDIARANHWDWFVTLTFSPQEVDRYDYDSVVSRLEMFTQYLRRYGCKWLLVPELHKDGAYHFHGLLQGDLKVKFWRRDKVQGIDLYNIVGYKLGWTTVSKVLDQGRVSSYITKYTTKQLLRSIPKCRRRYWHPRKGLEKVKIEKLEVSGKDFELILSKMRYVRRISDNFGNMIVVAEGENVNPEVQMEVG